MEYLNIIQKTFPEVGGMREDGEFYTGDGEKVDVSDEIKIKARAEADQDFVATQYQRDRLYPQIGEQLDMLFHDMTAGKGSKTGEWYKAIAKVKADHPKEAE
jgi:hypothetical protein